MLAAAAAAADEDDECASVAGPASINLPFTIASFMPMVNTELFPPTPLLLLLLRLAPSPSVAAC